MKNMLKALLFACAFQIQLNALQKFRTLLTRSPNISRVSNSAKISFDKRNFHITPEMEPVIRGAVYLFWCGSLGAYLRAEYKLYKIKKSWDEFEHKLEELKPLPTAIDFELERAVRKGDKKTADFCFSIGANPEVLKKD